MNLESAISALNANGWYLGSLCQLDQADWYACVIDDEGWTHSATGTTPVEAISAALSSRISGRVYDRAIADEQEAALPKLDLVALGLIKPRAPLDRRF